MTITIAAGFEDETKSGLKARSAGAARGADGAGREPNTATRDGTGACAPVSPLDDVPLCLGADETAPWARKRATRLTAHPVRGRFGAWADASAELVEILSDAPVVGRPVHLVLLQAERVVRLGTFLTDRRGRVEATLLLAPFDVPAPGRYVLAWVFDGDDTFAAPLPVAPLTVR